MTIKEISEAEPVAVDMAELSDDMKRLLNLQWREFVHFVEDRHARACQISKSDAA